MTSIFLPTGEDVEDICSKEELVTFSDVSCQYPPDQHVTVKYHVGSRVETSSSDWIGIFPHQWQDLNRPMAQIYLPTVGQRGHNKLRRKSVTFSADTVKELSKQDSSYQFVYVDVNQQVLGVSLPFKVEKTEVESKDNDGGSDSDGSDSPVLLSSASEEDDDWDLPTQVAPATGGQFSGSDLSDIVVLSSSPSQETAKEPMWIYEVTEPRDDKVSNINVEVMMNGQDIAGVEKETPFAVGKSSIVPEQQLKTLQENICPPMTPKSSVLTGWPRQSLMQQLRIVELNDSSDEEGVEDGRPESSRQTLIIEMPDSGKQYTNHDESSKVPTKLSTPAKTTNTVTVSSVVSTTYTAPSSISVAARRAFDAPAEKGKKSKKRKKREQRRVEASSDDGERDSCLVQQEEQSMIPSQPGVEELDVKFGLQFDELKESSLKTRKQKMKEARRQERNTRKKLSMADNDYCALQNGKRESQILQPESTRVAENTDFKDEGNELTKPERDVKGKQKKLKVGIKAKVELETKIATKESKAEADNNVEDSPTHLTSFSEIDEVANKRTTATRHQGLPGTELSDLKRKYSKAQKAKIARKARRSSSSRAKSHLDCEFQYLFSMNLKEGDQDKKDSATSDNTERNHNSATIPTIVIQDTSDVDFPALPSQEDTTATSPPEHVKQSIQGSDDNTKLDGEYEDADEDDLDIALNSVQNANWPCFLAAGSQNHKEGRYGPYLPPCVLDIMDALPPASSSPDGRAMMEWRRSLLPLVPKHALPVFRSRYKAKFAKKYETRRFRLRRGIIDNIRRQLDVVQKSKEPPTSQVTTMFESFGFDVSHKDVEPLAIVPPSYASIVKKSQESKDFKGENKTEDPTYEDNETHESQAPLGTQEYTIVSLEDDPATSIDDAQKQQSKVAPNFPKEYTNYTAGHQGTNQSNAVYCCTTQRQPESLSTDNRLSPEGAEMVRTFACPIKSASPDKLLGQTRGPTERLETPSLHIRPSARAKNMAQSSSLFDPPQQTGDNQEKVTVCAPQVDTGEQGALLNMALSSCLADNAQLRSTLVSVERQLQELKSEKYQKQREQEKQHPDDLPQQHDPLNEIQHPTSHTRRNRQVMRSPDNRKMPMLKWAGKVSKLVRSNTEVVSLSAKLKTSEQELVSLNNQVNALKEALQAETKRTTRALTKWFKLKLKVKVLRAKLRGLNQDKSASPTTVPKTKPNEEDRGQSVLKDHSDAESEPPCKKQRIESTQDVRTFAKRSVTSQSSQQSQTPESHQQPPSLCIPKYPVAAIPPPMAVTHPSPPAAAVFRLFPGYSGQRGTPEFTPCSQPQQVVAPFYHNHHQQLPQQQQQFNHVAAAHYQSVQRPPPPPQPSRPNIRRSSPSHLPLPTPKQQQQPVASPPAARITRPQDQLPPSSPLSWPLPLHVPIPAPSIRVLDHSPSLSPWSPASPPASTPASPWSRPAGQAQDQYGHWQHRPDQTWFDPPGRSQIFHENTLYAQLQRDNEPRPQTFFTSRAGAPNTSIPQQPPSMDAPHNYFQFPPSILPTQAPTPVQLASPPGQYRSDFMRRLMQGEAGLPRRQPNPYRLFHQVEAPLAHDFIPTGLNIPSPPYGFAPDLCIPPPPLQQHHQQQSPPTAQTTTGLSSPQLMPVVSPEVSYRNTSAFLELTADGLVEATRREMTTFNNIDPSSRLIESSPACPQTQV